MVSYPYNGSVKYTLGQIDPELFFARNASKMVRELEWSTFLMEISSLLHDFLKNDIFLWFSMILVKKRIFYFHF